MEPQRVALSDIWRMVCRRPHSDDLSTCGNSTSGCPTPKLASPWLENNNVDIATVPRMIEVAEKPMPGGPAVYLIRILESGRARLRELHLKQVTERH
jgi:hypothetical protein